MFKGDSELLAQRATVSPETGGNEKGKEMQQWNRLGSGLVILARPAREGSKVDRFGPPLLSPFLGIKGARP